jgi:signal peptidase I
VAESAISSRDRKRSQKEQKGKPTASKAPPEKPSESVMEFISSIANVFVIGLFIITFVVQAFEIPSGSMLQTLQIGDHLFVDRERVAPETKWAASFIPYRPIHRGDIVVFVSPAQPGLFLVKRIRGVPGDRLHLSNGRLYINGQLQDEPFVQHTGPSDTYKNNFPDVPPSELEAYATPEWQLTMANYKDKDGNIVVPPDRYFAMGDNRDNSYDSRFWGFVPRENVVGRPLFIYWSFETPDKQYEKTAWSDRLAFIGHVVLHFFDETRWSRTLRMVR